MKFENNPIIYLARKLWKYSEGNRKNLFLYFSFFIIADAIDLLEPLVVAQILNTIQEQGVTHGSMPSLLIFLSFFALIELGFWAFHGPARVIENKNAFLVRANYKKYLLDGTMALPSEWHVNHHSGDTIDKIEKGTRSLYDYAGDTFLTISALVRLVGSCIALVYFNLSSTYIVLFVVIIAGTIVVKFDKVLIRRYRELYGAENKISEKVFDVISNITTVIILRVEKLLSRSIFRKIMEPYQLYTVNSKLNEVKWFLVALSGTFMTIAVLFSYIYSNFRAGTVIFVGTLYALYGYVQKVKDLLFNFTFRYSDIVRQKAAVMNAEELAHDFQIISKAKPIDLTSKWQELKIENLVFSYHTQEGGDLHLDDISISIENGQRIALIGESGSGKTTLLKIIRELYHPNHVNVYLDGVILKNAFRSVSSDISLIPQDPEIFSTTILENITLGANHEISYVKKFTDMACFTEVALRLPQKLDSYIFEKGVNLSGGEKQRLALARGLMASEDKSIVLLDEPTSSVDTKNELQIYKNIFAGFKNKTIIASVHRLHLLPLFDNIYFFKTGKVIASGALEELFVNSKQFKNLWEKYHKAGKRKGTPGTS